MDAFKDTRVLAEAALAIALEFVLGLITVFRMPLGGSISLEMVPLVLLVLRQGWKVGMLAGAVYNAAYLVPSLIVTLVVVVALLRTLENDQPSRRQRDTLKPQATR